MTKSIPEGWHSLTPRLVVHDVKLMVEFLSRRSTRLETSAPICRQ